MNENTKDKEWFTLKVGQSIVGIILYNAKSGSYIGTVGI